MTAEESPSGRRRPAISAAGLAHLLVVYVVWGSTYLAIRIAVRGHDGFPPFLLGASRTLTAAVLLLAWSLLRGSSLRPSTRDRTTLIVSGLLLWVGGNGLVNWAETRADSGYAALLIGTTPLWVALTESILDRRIPSFKLIAALILGFAGLGVLTYPVARSGGGGDVGAVVALLFAPLSWGIGSIFQARRPLEKISPAASAGYQQLVGGAGFIILSLLLRESRPHPSPGAWLAWGYLVVAGSVIAFTSYLRALRLLPTRIVMTYSYVNPVIAVFLGWIILGERVTGWTMAGTALILLGVAGVFSSRLSGPKN